MIRTLHINTYQFLVKSPELLKILLNLGPKILLFYLGPEAAACPSCTQGRYWSIPRDIHIYSDQNVTAA